MRRLSKEQHKELYLAGQLMTHLTATQLGGGDGPPPLSEEQKLKALLYVLHLDYPNDPTSL